MNSTLLPRFLRFFPLGCACLPHAPALRLHYDFRWTLCQLMYALESWSSINYKCSFSRCNISPKPQATIQISSWVEHDSFLSPSFIETSSISTSCPIFADRKKTDRQRDRQTDNNYNTLDNVLWCCQVISRVHPVHLTNVGQRQMAADSQTRPVVLSVVGLLAVVVDWLVLSAERVWNVLNFSVSSCRTYNNSTFVRLVGW